MHGPPPHRSRDHTIRLVAIFMMGVALGLVLLGIWQQGRCQAQQAPESQQSQEQATEPAPDAGLPPGAP